MMRVQILNLCSLQGLKMIKIPKIKDGIIHTINDFSPGDIIEFVHPVSGCFAVGEFVKVIRHRTGDCHTDIELKTAGGKAIITEENIRWDRSMYYKNKGSETKCNYQKTLNM